MDLELTYIKRPDGSKTLTMPEDRRTAAVAYLREGGAMSAAEIMAMVEDGHRAVLRAIAGLSDVQAAHKPGLDTWSALELMAHVVTGKQIVAALCPSLAVGRLPPGFGPALEGEDAQDGVTVSRFETLDAARAAAGEAHAALLSFLRGADPQASSEMTFKHFVFGSLNCREWAMFQRLHDDDHWPQVAAIRASEGFPAR